MGVQDRLQSLVRLGSMTPIIFTTEGLPKAQQLDAWRGWFDTVFEVEIDDPRQGFSATSETWDLGGFGLTRVRAPRLRALRTANLVRRNPVDHWGVAFGYQRTLGESGKQGTLDLPANTPYVASFGRPLVSQRDADERLQLYLPRDSFPGLSAVFEAVEGRPLAGRMGQLLSEFIALMARTASALSNTDPDVLQTAVRGMLLACVAPSADHSVMAEAPLAATRKEVVRRLIDLHLNSPTLGPGFLCREAGMSRSQLYRLFESEGGVAHYVQRRRLRRCFTELSRNAGGRSVSAIAADIGFSDPSSFSRSFRKEFGLAPRDVMYSRLSGAPVEAVLAQAQAAEVPNLDDLLRQIARG